MGLGWRTWKGVDEEIETAPTLLSCDWWTSAMTEGSVHFGHARSFRRHFGGKAPTLVGALYQDKPYVAVRINLARASIAIRDSMKNVVSRAWPTKLGSLCKQLQQQFPDACQDEPTCVSSDKDAQQTEGPECALFAFANITAMVEGNAKTYPAKIAADLRGGLAQVLWARGMWGWSSPGLRQQHPTDFTGADITFLREWREEFFGSSRADTGVKAPAAEGNTKEVRRGRSCHRMEPPPRVPPPRASKRNTGEASAPPFPAETRSGRRWRQSWQRHACW